MLHGPEDEMSDVDKKLYGSKGLPQASPLGAIPAMLTGEMFSPPAVASAIDLMKAGFDGNSDKLMRQLGTATLNFGPGSGVVRFITDDMVTYIEGERHEGNFFEKVIKFTE